MKKTFLPIFCLVALGLTSCDLGGDDSTSSSSYGTINLVTQLGTGESLMSTGNYSFNFNLTQQTAVISTTDLIFPSTGSQTSKHSLTTESTSYVQGLFSNGTFLLKVLNAGGMVDNDNSLSLQGFQIRVTNYVYTPSEDMENTNYVIGVSGASVARPAVISEYSIGGLYNVRTVPLIAFYKGTTTTDITSSSATLPSYKTEDMLYGVFLHKDMSKADVVIYNAKFAAAAPALTAVVLKDLKVECADKTYTITGTDVIPQVVEGSGLTPNERFPFKEFSFTATGSWLHAASITYKVGDNYSGRFYGTYLPEEVITQN